MFKRANNPRELKDEDVDLALLEEAAGRLSAAGPLHDVLDQLVGFVTTVVKIGVLVGAEIERARLGSENTLLLDKLEMRTVVDRAKGILQRELSISEQDAYRIMQRESQQRRKSMAQIAEAIILSDEMKRSYKSRACDWSGVGRESFWFRRPTRTSSFGTKPIRK
jgi:ANTAR domain